MFETYQGAGSLVVLAFALLIVAACASPRSPTGGPEDMAPPSLIQEESTPNHQTHFTEKEIVLTFDEWVSLKDVYTQLVISPLMPENPEIKQKGKAVIISLPDSLEEETTYTINFGNAIADLTEGNVLENFAFVFSTGAVLDSHSMSGHVIDATSLKPAEGIWVMLHTAGIDSAVYKQKPDYVAKTNKEGNWSLKNIRTDTFQVMALKDENLNFLYDQETEWFGWLENPVIDSTLIMALPDITVFPREKRIAIADVTHFAPGWLKLTVSSSLPKPQPVFLPGIENAIMTWDRDTLHAWYAPEKNYSGYAVLNGDSTLIRKSNDPSMQNDLLTLKPIITRIHPSSPALSTSEVPLTNIDTTRIMVTHDSLGNFPFSIYRDSIRTREFEIKAAWIALNRFTITFLPGALTDHWGRLNDTLRQSLVINNLDQYGDLTIHVDGLDSTKAYLLEIKSGEQVLWQFVIKQLAKTQVKKSAMLPGKYTVEVVQDENENKAWDTGDYYHHRQPERKMIFPLDNLRAGWELESQITWK